MPTKYVVVVQEPADIEGHIRHYERRFEFTDELEALSCASSAEASGFVQHLTKVETRVKTRSAAHSQEGS